jgi:uncharacterized phage-associated protein
MATACDVAAHILSKCGRMTAMKLQKLVYYSQAWSLAWDNVPLFDEPIQAWANGPVVRSLYMQHRGFFEVDPSEIKGDASALSADQIESIDTVLGFYCEYTPLQLSEMTHSELPWQNARQGLAPGERGDSIISEEDMLEFYSSLI